MQAPAGEKYAKTSLRRGTRLTAQGESEVISVNDAQNNAQNKKQQKAQNKNQQNAQNKKQGQAQNKTNNQEQF